MSYTLKIIGNSIKMPQRVDRYHRMTNYIRDSMRIVDIIPTEIRIDPTKILKYTQYPIMYLFDDQIEKYKQDCATYDLEGFSGIRCYLTDETISQEDFSNSYEESPIQSTVRDLANSNKMMRMLASLRSISSKSTQLAGQTQGIANTESFQELQENDYLFNNTQNLDFGEAMASASKVFKNVILQGKNVSLPKIWLDSTYTPSLQLNIKLISPYGAPNCIKKYVITPLMYLLIMVAPRTNDGLSYGYPRILRINYYGNSTINAGYISNLSIRRGGDDSNYNQYRQPLSVFVNMTIEPLVTGFGTLERSSECPISDGSINDVDQQYDDTISLQENLYSPLITTVGTVIKSFKPYYSKPISEVIKTSSKDVIKVSSTLTPSINTQLTSNILSNQQSPLQTTLDIGNDITNAMSNSDLISI